MKTLKVLLQEVVSGIKAWVNSNFAQESNTVHKTGDETVNGDKTFTGNVFQNQAGGTNVYCATCDGAVKGDLTSSGTFSIVCKDGSNANMETSGLAAVYMGQDTSGSYVALRADTAYNDTRYNASVSLDIDPTTANNNAIFRPRRDNTIDLGSSSYQFKNTYTKGLYVDGNQVDPTLFPFMLVSTTNGGLFPYCKLGYDDYVGKGFNDLTDTGIYRPRTDPTVPNTPDAGTIDGILVVFNASNAANISNNRRCRQIYYTFNSNPRTFTRYGNLSSTTGNWTWQDWVEVPTNRRDFIPLTDNSINLGSTTNRWKTFNGLNPGALSLPDKSKAASIDTTNFEYGSDFTFTPTVSGWLFVNVTNCTKASLKTGVGEYFFNQSSDWFRDTFPVIAGEKVTLLLFSTATSKPTITLFPCQGNV